MVVAVEYAWHDPQALEIVLVCPFWSPSTATDLRDTAFYNDNIERPLEAARWIHHVCAPQNERTDGWNAHPAAALRPRECFSTA
jgi:hypothetical protein